jgi:hypothetical protein
MATVEPKDNLEEVGRRVAESWEPAQAHWSHFLLLREPTDDPKQPAIAQINLATRQVSLHFGQVVRKSLFDCVEALLAHEIGHHVRFPGSLAVEARLRLLEKSLIPLDDYSTLNLFTDLLINEQLGPLYHEQFVRVYQAFDPFDDWESDPAFLFYLAVYEELWRLKPGTLLGPARSRFETTYGGYRADAQLLTQNLFGLGPNLYTQFLYFASVICRYLQPLRGKKLVCRDPNQCGRGDPSTDDWADALVPSAREEEAIRRALHEGWITEKQGERMTGANGLETRILGLPGQGTDNAEKVPEVMAAYYRQQAQRYLLRPPPQRTLGEAVVPTTLDDWEPGDAVRDIDWLGTLVQRGPVLGAAQPLRRARIAELEGHDVPLWQPRVEIYLDVSGSMPDPRTTRNALTLAAMVLTTGAIRAGGWVRTLLYSGEPVAYWQWCRSETELSRFLMHYIGGGTEFPFGVLRESVEKCGHVQPIRVIITDPDFDQNYDAATAHARLFAEAVRRSPHFVLLLHRPRPEAVARYRSTGARVVEVAELEDFPRMAGDLSCALFEEQSHADRGLVP